MTCDIINLELYREGIVIKRFAALLLISIAAIAFTGCSTPQMMDFSEDDLIRKSGHGFQIKLKPALGFYSVKMVGKERFDTYVDNNYRTANLKEYFERMKQLQSSGKYEMVLPAFNLDGNEPSFWLTNGVIAQFKNQTSSDEVTRLVKQRTQGKFTVRPLSLQPNLFIIELEPYQNLNPFRLARSLEKETAVDFAEPNMAHKNHPRD